MFPLSRAPSAPLTPAAPQRSARPTRPQRLRLSERLLLLAAALGAVHHADHVLRVYSGWPFLPQVTPFTFSLLVYPMVFAALRARAHPWFRAGATALLLVATQASHVFLETPHDQFETWASGASTAHHTLGQPNLLGVQSPLLGALAVVLSVTLSALLLAATVAALREALWGGPGTGPAMEGVSRPAGGMRAGQRVLHLAASVVLGAYIYSPWGADPTFSVVVRFLLLPLLAATGLAMWQYPRVARAMRGRRALVGSGMV